MFRDNNLRPRVVVMAAALLSSVAQANDDVQINGFLNQAVIYSPDNPLYDKDTGVNFNYRDIGLTGSWQINDRIRVAGQILSRYVGGLDDGSPKLDFALADYRLLSAPNFWLGLRVGRVKTPFGIYNTVRDVPHIRPGVFVPQAVYFQSFRDALLSLDGGEFYSSLDLGWGEFDFNVYAGDGRVTEKALEYTVFQQDIAGEYKTGGIKGAKLSFVPSALPSTNLSVSYFTITFDLEDIPPLDADDIAQGVVELGSGDPRGFGQYVTSASLDVDIMLYSLQHTWRDWVFNAEFLKKDILGTNISVLGIGIPDLPQNLEAYYIQAEKLLSAQFSVFARYESIVNDTNSPKGEAFEALTGGNPYTQYNRATSLGARWYITQDLSVTAEASHNNGAAFLVGPDNINYSTLKKEWDFLVLQFSYHF